MSKDEQSMVLYERAAVANIPDALNLRAIATDLLNSGLYPNIKNATQAIAVIATGQEIGLGPTASLTYIAPVNGRMCMESKLMLALFHRSGGKSKILKRDNESCQIEFSKAGREPFVFEYTAAMAKTEQLWDKPTWKKMPATQLQWRCISNGIKAYDPGVIMGIAMSKEEAEDYPYGIQAEAETKPEPAKRGPGRPKAEKPTPEPKPEPEKPKEEAKPPVKEPPLEGFDAPPAEDDIAAQAESPESSKEEEEVILDIKAKIEAAGVDIKEFKEWLIGWQGHMKPAHVFLVKLGKSIRFHGAPMDDLKYLRANMTGAFSLFEYHKAKAREKAEGKEEPKE